jgi:toxin-antitoxin system PIN domain toxin
VIALDTNILVYAHRNEMPMHHQALALTRDFTLGGAWAIPWPCVYEFYAVVTNPRVWRGQASTIAQARAQIERWLASPSLLLLRETHDFANTLFALLDECPVVGAKIHDARIAALCLAHGVTELLTADRDFALFPTLKARNPFA